MPRTSEVVLLISSDEGTTWAYYTIVDHLGTEFVVSRMDELERDCSLRFLSDANITSLFSDNLPVVRAVLRAKEALVRKAADLVPAETHLLFKRADSNNWWPFVVTTKAGVNLAVISDVYHSLNIGQEEVTKLLAGEEVSAALNWDVVLIKKDPLFDGTR